VLTLGAALLAPSMLAQVSRYDEKQMGPVNDKPPAVLSKVGIAQRRGGVAPVVKELLPLPHHSQVSIVDERDLDA